jgi:hypothetical protein
MKFSRFRTAEVFRVFIVRLVTVAEQWVPEPANICLLDAERGWWCGGWIFLQISFRRARHPRNICELVCEERMKLTANYTNGLRDRSP